jgi:hypothetical protein
MERGRIGERIDAPVRLGAPDAVLGDGGRRRDEELKALLADLLHEARVCALIRIVEVGVIDRGRPDEEREEGEGGQHADALRQRAAPTQLPPSEQDASSAKENQRQGYATEKPVRRPGIDPEAGGQKHREGCRESGGPLHRPSTQHQEDQNERNDQDR